MKTKMWLEPKLAAFAVMAAVLAGCSKSAQTPGGDDKMAAEEITAKSRDAYAALSSYSDSGSVVSEMAGQRNTLTFNTRLQRPNLYRFEWSRKTALVGDTMPCVGVLWSDGTANHFQSAIAGQENNPKSREMPDMKQSFSQAAGPSWSAASTVAGAFFNQDLGDVFVAAVVSGRCPLKKEKDAMAGGVDCYVVSGVIDSAKLSAKGKSGTAATTLWIGKGDFLIHQSRTKYVVKMDSGAPASDQAVDDAIKQALAAQNKPATPEAIAAMRPQMREIMKQVQTTLKAGFESGVVTTETREDIVVNRQFSPADFAR